ncbi:MAG TPA: SDR family NAD(P)-dependent oxidoreductase [Symbiobacteriaceae bacterium]|nr:SDR family NAD(P)-dependent oxidoreductase [Symbiobacteriaceae bacterium]
MLTGKVALVTGAAGGLGRAFCRALAAAGADLALADLDEAGLAAVVAEVESLPPFVAKGRRALSLPMDLRQSAAITAGVKRAAAEFGGVDILVNNAGGSLYTPKAIESITEADWDLVLGVNLKGAFLCCQAALPFMRARGGGRIINVSSIGGRTASPVTGAAYAAAKAGLIGLTRRLAKELGPDEITVNAIAPGTVLSGERMVDLWQELSPEEQGRILADVPLGRLSTAEEQADVLLFLAGPGARYITGAVIDVNGGRFMG